MACAEPGKGDGRGDIRDDGPVVVEGVDRVANDLDLLERISLFSPESIQRGSRERRPLRKLSARERAGLIKAIASQLRPYMSDMNIKSEHQLREVAAENVEAIPGKGVRLFFAQMIGTKLCGTVGNCSF